MNKEAAEVLKHIANKLDIPVEQLWAGLIAYAPFTFYQWITGIALGTIVCIVLWALCWKTFPQGKESPLTFMWGACAGMLTMALLFEGLNRMPDALAAWNAPQAWAAKIIIDKVRR